MIRKKRKMGSKKKTHSLPGTAIVRHIEYGLPKINGVYFVYYKGQRASSGTYPIADYGVCTFVDGYYGTNKEILAYIGPIPLLALDDIMEKFEDENIPLHTYFVGTLKGPAKRTWKYGPYPESIYVTLSKGEPGDYGFEVNQRTTLPKPISYFSKKHNKWCNIKNVGSVIKKLQKLQKRAKNQTKKAKSHFAIATIKQMKLKKYEPYDSIMAALKVIPKEKNVYIFDMLLNAKIPRYHWKKGWSLVSDKKITAIRKRIGDL